MSETSKSFPLVRIDPGKIQGQEFTQQSWLDILDDPLKREWLLLISTHYSDVFHSVVRDCIKLRNISKVLYLIDFDVLRDYLEIRSMDDLGSFPTDWLFYSSKQEYGIPIGAFLELIDYLNELAETTHKTRVYSQMSPRKVIYQIAGAVGVEDINEMDQDEIIEEIANRIRGKALTLERLVVFLTDERFVGVVSGYERDVADTLKKALKKLPRRGKRWGSRSKVDRRDAMNLSIALSTVPGTKQVIQMSLPKVRQGYILVSRTSIIVRLLERLRQDLDPWEGEKLIRSICDTLGVEETELGLHFPVMSPLEVVTLEILGIYESPGQVFIQSRGLQEDFGRVVNYLENRLASPENQTVDELTDKLLVNYLETERKMVAQRLSSITNTILSPDSEGLRQLEMFRATSESVGYARREQKSSIMPFDRLRQESTVLLRRLHEAKMALAEAIQAAQLQYSFRLLDVGADHIYQRIEILGHWGDKHSVSIMEGESYLASNHEGRAKPEYYCLRWPVVCTEVEFLEAIKEIMATNTGWHPKQDEPPDNFMLTEITSLESSLWHEGLVIYAGNRVYGEVVTHLLRTGCWKFMHLDQLALQISKKIHEDTMVGGTGDPYVSDIQQYRINTPFGDFAFDIEPVEGEISRYLTVISHFNLGSHLAILYKITGMTPAVPANLGSRLTEALSGFQLPPEKRTNEEQR